MKKLMMAALVAATVSASVYAQPPAPRGGAPVPPPPGGIEAGLPAPPPNEKALQQVSTFNGKSVKMVTNDDYVYDGFFMINNGDSVLVKFPPHLGNQIMSVVKDGNSVSVTGVLHATPAGTKEIRMLSVTAGSKTVSDTMTTLPATAPVESLVSGNGKITSLQKDREGRVHGFILNNNTILHLPPQAASQLSSSVNNGSEITYTGRQKQSNNGEVSQGNYKIVHCTTITVNGQQYML